MKYPKRHRLLVAAAIMLTAQAGARDWHVSTRGSDANAGTRAGTALQTIQAAVDQAMPGDTVVVHAGTYRETVAFSRNGTAKAPITIKPYRQGRVIISGCDPVSGWTLHDPKKNIWRAPMPWTLGVGRNQVFADGKALIEARYPNMPGPKLGMYVSDLSPLWPTFGEFSIPAETAQSQPGRIVSKLLEGTPDNHWQGAIYYGIHYEGWCAQTGIIESSRAGEIQVGDRTQGWWFPLSAKYQSEEGRGMIVGHLNALDQPGEWFWQDNVLYLIPLSAGPPEKIEAKRRQLAFDLSDRQFITLRNLEVCAASMRMADAQYCAIDSCRFSYISHFMHHYAAGVLDKTRDTINSGETGIFVSGRDNTFANCELRYSAGAGLHLRGYRQTVHNSLIDEVNYTSHYLNAITQAVAEYTTHENFLQGGHVITYNTMRNAGRHFFNFNGNASSTHSRDQGPQDYLAVLFAHNHLYNGMLTSKDAGFMTGYFTSGGTLHGLNSQVAYNVMHDCYDRAGMKWQQLGIIYLDAGTSNVDVHHNLLWAAPGSLPYGLHFNTACVDSSEADNRFYKEFTRTCAELEPDDFPDARPFRFGHDFAHPPAIPAWPPVKTQTLEITLPDAPTGKNGDSLNLGEIDFDNHWDAIIMQFAGTDKGMNANRAARGKPRHHHATDPLVLDVLSRDDGAATIKKQWSFIYNVQNTNWISFKQVPLGEGYRRFRVVYGNVNAGIRSVSVHLDKVDGPEVARVGLEQTDRNRGSYVQLYSQATAELDASATGNRDVYLVFHAADDLPVGEFTYFRFEQYRGQIPLQPGEVKFELRLDRPDGEKIGELYPRDTGGADRYRDLVARLEPVSGKRHLFLHVRSALDKTAGRIQGFTLAGPSGPLDLAAIGVGAAPRRSWRGLGRMILPKPTHQPCAKPAHEYLQGIKKRTKAEPRPLAIATRLARPPVLDGSLDDWDLNRNPLPLQQSCDGKPTQARPSTAWIGYDDNAFYIAARHPVKDSRAIARLRHRWGADDAMEVSFQDAFSGADGPIFNLYGWPDGYVQSNGVADTPASAVAKLQAAVSYKAVVGKDSWTCEWRIPFSACNFTPETAPLLQFNLAVRKQSEDAWVLWCGTGGSTFVVGNAGALVFPETCLQAGLPVRQGLALWLDAADKATLSMDEDGGISSWNDKSGNGRNATQPEARYRPIFSATALNGLPAIRFQGAKQNRLEAPALATSETAGMIFAIYNDPPDTCSSSPHQRLFSSSNGLDYDYKTGFYLIKPEAPTEKPAQLTASFQKRCAEHVRIGCFSPQYQTFFTGHLGELLVYADMLDDKERDRIRAYILCKWENPFNKRKL